MSISLLDVTSFADILKPRYTGEQIESILVNMPDFLKETQRETMTILEHSEHMENGIHFAIIHSALMGSHVNDQGEVESVNVSLQYKVSEGNFFLLQEIHPEASGGMLVYIELDKVKEIYQWAKQFTAQELKQLHAEHARSPETDAHTVER